MLIGIVASGKSTYAKKLAEETDTIILSSDQLREEMYGDISDQTHNAEVFAELHKRCKENLQKQVNIIYDATNVNMRKRLAFFRELKDIDCYKKAIVFATPYELCLEQNSKRDRKVPEDVIKRMRENFHFPLYNEGFDEIEFVWNMGDTEFDMFALLDKAANFEQCNRHHSFNLEEHMWKTAMGLPDKCKVNHVLFTAARLHDIGKLETQSFVDRKGNPTDEAHYYQHQYAGGYEAMFYLKQHGHREYSDEEILHICTLIQYHMHPYIAWRDSEKARNRDRQLFGDEMYEEVWSLHRADRDAH